MEDSRDTELRLLAQRAVRELREQRERVGGRDGGEPAVVRLVSRMIALGIERAASDIHIEPQARAVRLRYRCDGLLRELDEALLPAIAAALISRIKVMAGLDIAQHQRPQDGHIRHAVGGVGLDIRVSIVPSLYGEMVVMRLMNLENRLLQMGELGFSSENEAIARALIRKPSGLLLLCGPMNSGKTTTLYAAMAELNDISRNLVTLEDPIERVLPGVNQVQLNPKAGLTYVTGLRAILRQDSETILLGEIRDEETAETAVRIALTGHLIMTTLHTDTAVSAIYRLLEMRVAPYLLAATLNGIIAQRLVRRICPHCREAYTVERGSKEAALLGADWREDKPFYRGAGCARCHGSGYSGRVALQEVLVADDMLREAILGKWPRQRTEALARQHGMKTLADDGFAKAAAGITSLDEVRRVLHGTI